MGTGASSASVNAAALFAEADDEALLSVLCQDVKSAQRLLRQAERLMWLGGFGPESNPKVMEAWACALTIW